MSMSAVVAAGVILLIVGANVYHMTEGNSAKAIAKHWAYMIVAAAVVMGILFFILSFMPTESWPADETPPPNYPGGGYGP